MLWSPVAPFGASAVMHASGRWRAGLRPPDL